MKGMRVRISTHIHISRIPLTDCHDSTDKLRSNKCAKFSMTIKLRSTDILICNVIT